jgi:hypothetical protein
MHIMWLNKCIFLFLLREIVMTAPPTPSPPHLRHSTSLQDFHKGLEATSVRTHPPKSYFFNPPSTQFLFCDDASSLHLTHFLTNVRNLRARKGHRNASTRALEGHYLRSWIHKFDDWSSRRSSGYNIYNYESLLFKKKKMN